MKEKIVANVETIENKTIKIENGKEESNSHKKNKYKVILCLVILVTIVGSVFYYKNNIPVDIETIKDSVVMVKVYDDNNNEISTGSGFCVYKSNYIVTNYHVISGAYKITIVSDNGKEYDVENIEIFNKENDLAILKCDSNFNPLKIGNTNDLKAGENIIAIGSPKGQLNTVSKGIISNADDDYEIRITAPISPR